MELNRRHGTNPHTGGYEPATEVVFDGSVQDNVARQRLNELLDGEIPITGVVRADESLALKGGIVLRGVVNQSTIEKMLKDTFAVTVQVNSDHL